MRRWRVRMAIAVLVALLIPAVPALAVPAQHNANQWLVRSPSGQLTAEVSRDVADGTLSLQVRSGEGRITTSSLGLTTEDGDFTHGLRFESAQRSTVTERYETAVGKRRRHSDTAQQLELTFSNPDGTPILVQV
jgi:alpha-glucosidase